MKHQTVGTGCSGWPSGSVLDFTAWGSNLDAEKNNFVLACIEAYFPSFCVQSYTQGDTVNSVL